MRPQVGAGFVREVAHDGIGFRQHPRAVPKHGNLSIGIEREELRRPALAAEDIHSDEFHGRLQVASHGTGLSGIQELTVEEFHGHLLSSTRTRRVAR
jgi:hypothetical protein